jgi:hypothetical protein
VTLDLRFEIVESLAVGIVDHPGQEAEVRLQVPGPARDHVQLVLADGAAGSDVELADHRAFGGHHDLLADRFLEPQRQLGAATGRHNDHALGRLEPLEVDPHRVGVRDDEEELERAVRVRDLGQAAPLTLELDSDTGHWSTVRIQHRAGHQSCPRRVRQHQRHAREQHHPYKYQTLQHFLVLPSPI